MDSQATISVTDDNPLNKTSKFASGILPIIILGGSIGSMIVFGVLNWNKLNVTADALKSLDEKVSRQYSVQKASEDRMRAELDIIKAWVEFRKGYEQAIKDAKK